MDFEKYINWYNTTNKNVLPHIAAQVSNKHSLHLSLKNKNSLGVVFKTGLKCDILHIEYIFEYGLDENDKQSKTVKFTRNTEEQKRFMWTVSMSCSQTFFIS